MRLPSEELAELMENINMEESILNNGYKVASDITDDGVINLVIIGDNNALILDNEILETMDIKQMSDCPVTIGSDDQCILKAKDSETYTLTDIVDTDFEFILTKEDMDILRNLC